MPLREDRLPGSPRSSLYQTYQFATDPTSFLDELHGQYGDIFTLRLLGNRPWVCLSAPEDIATMYAASPDVLQSGRAAGSIFAPLTGWNASLTLDGGAHRDRRRILLPAFTANSVNVFAATIAKLTSECLASWPMDRPFELHPHLQTIALGVIMHAIFGLAPGGDTRRLASLVKRLGEVGMSSPLLFVPALQLNLGRFSPWGRILDLVKETRGAISCEIDRRRSMGSCDGNDTLSVLLRHRSNEGLGLDRMEISDELIALLIAGYETTHIAMAWVFERILTSPPTLQAVRHETIAVVDVSEIGKLRYLDAVIRESLRMRPVSPICGGRLVTSPFRVGGYVVPPGFVLTNCSYLLHRRKDVYPDPEVFRPDRFLDARPAANEFTTFGGGNRQCIGSPLAVLEIKIVVATVLRALELQLQGRVTTVGRGVHLVPRGGLQIVARPIGRVEPSVSAS